MENELERYSELLQRPAWWAKRVLVADKAHYRCEKCGKYLPIIQDKPTGEAHHKKYTTKYPWNEPMENMQYLCHDCHEEVHGRTFGEEVYSHGLRTVGTVLKYVFK